MEEETLGSPEASDDFGARNPSSEVAGTSSAVVEVVGIPATGELSSRGETIVRSSCVSTLNYIYTSSK